MIKGNDFVVTRLENYLKEQIAKGNLREGDRLLSERDIGKLFNVSGMAVHNAMKGFIDRGILEKVPRKGTFVRRTPGIRPETKRIGVLFCHGGIEGSIFTVSFFSSIIAGIDRQARLEKKNLSFSYLLAEGKERAAEILVEQLQENDGLIIIDLFPAVYDLLEEHLKDTRAPVVLLNYEGADDRIDTITMDSRGNVRKMAQFLIDRGHSRIALGYTHSDDVGGIHPNFLNRIGAFKEVMRENGLAFNDTDIYDIYKPFFRSMMEKPDRPTAFFCLGDEFMHRIYNPAREMGVRVPEDLTVVGHDGTREGGIISPSLTTVATPREDMGALAVRRLAARREELSRGIRTHYRMVLPGTLVERESHASVPHTE